MLNLPEWKHEIGNVLTVIHFIFWRMFVLYSLEFSKEINWINQIFTVKVQDQVFYLLFAAVFRESLLTLEPRAGSRTDTTANLLNLWMKIYRFLHGKWWRTIFTHEFVFTKRTSEALRASEFCENKLVRKYRTKALSMMKFVYYIQTEIFLKLKMIYLNCFYK